MLGNLHVRFGVGAGVKLPGPHHASWSTLYLAEVSTTAEGTTGCLHLALSGLQSGFDLHGGAQPRQDRKPEFKTNMMSCLVFTEIDVH